MSEVKTKFTLETINNIISKSESTDHPFYVADLSDVVYKYRCWRSQLPNVEAFYAVKCNPDPLVLRLMVSLGLRFECASQGEIEAVLSAGAQPSDVIYGHPIKSVTSLRYASSVGVDLMAFDNEAELRKIKNTCPDARLLLRIRIPDVPAVFPLGDKFGCDLKETEHLLQLSKDLYLNIIGVSFHVGSMCQDPSAFARAIGMVRQVFDAAENMGLHLTLLDIGGGYPGATGYSDVFDEMCHFIDQGLEEHFPDNRGLRIIGEPGTYMVGSAFTVCMKILGRRVEEAKPEDRDLNCAKNVSYACAASFTGGSGARRKIHYYMNDGIYGSLCRGFEKYGFNIRTLMSKSQLASRKVVPSKMWGATCCCSDCLLDDLLLPEMEVGEHLVLDNMGAYTLCLTTGFNGLPMPGTHYIFPQQSMYRNEKLQSWEEFCRELDPDHLKSVVKIQDDVRGGDANKEIL